MPGKMAVRPPGWTLLSATTAPVALIGGWTWAAHAQPPTARPGGGYSAIHQTISALAAHGATDRWIMTTGLAALGVSHAVTAAGLRSARPAGRYALALGGLATLAVAAFPQPVRGSAPAHVAAAAVGFFSLTAWPVLATVRAAPRDRRTGLLARRPAALASLVLAGLLVWFGVELNGDLVGVSERALAGAQSLWPLAVVASLWASARGRRSPP